MLTKTEAIKAIERAFFKLERACESTRHWDQYLALIEREERQHRKLAPEGYKSGLTFKQTVHLFAVKTIFDRFIPNDSGRIYMPEPHDYFSTKGSVFGACVLAHDMSTRIQDQFTPEVMRSWLASVDYTTLSRGA